MYSYFCAHNHCSPDHNTRTPPALALSLQAPLVDATFKQASYDWVQNLVTATTKWGDLAQWDTSGVKDFSYAFSKDRNIGGANVASGNLKAVTFAPGPNQFAKWDTASVTTMRQTFYGAAGMNADLSAWNVAKVTTLQQTFSAASTFVGTGLAKWNTASVTTLAATFTSASAMNGDVSGWDVAKVAVMSNTFLSTSLTSCNKRRIADAWKTNAQFASWDADWSADKCPPVRSSTMMRAMPYLEVFPVPPSCSSPPHLPPLLSLLSSPSFLPCYHLFHSPKQPPDNLLVIPQPTTLHLCPPSADSIP